MVSAIELGKSIHKLIIPIRLEISEVAGLYYLCSDNKQRR